MISYDKAEKLTGYRKNADFITNIIAKVGNETVYSLSTNPYLRTNPVVKFNYIYEGRSDNIEIIAYDNKGKKFTSSTKIQNSLGKNKLLHKNKTNSKTINYRTKKPKVWNITNLEDAVEELYGLKNTIKDKIDLSVQEPFHLTIKSDLELESIAIFTNATPLSTIAILSIPNNVRINYRLPLEGLFIRSRHGVKITVVGKDKDGQLYSAEFIMPFYSYC